MSTPDDVAAADPSVQSNAFSERLTEAIARSGLSLHRIGSRLSVQRQRVSIATLSNWSTGRSLPARGRSREVVSTLEHILELPQGWLADAIPGAVVEHDLAARLGKRELIAQLRETYQLAESKAWRPDFVHFHVTVGTDRVERSLRTDVIETALCDDAVGWVVGFNDAPEPVEVLGLVGVQPRQVIEVDDQLTLVELRLPRPFTKGESVFASHEFICTGSQPASEVQYALHLPCEQLVVAATFEGRLPRHAVRTFQAPDQPPVEVGPAVVVGQTIQAVVQQATIGLHGISWTW